MDPVGLGCCQATQVKRTLCSMANKHVMQAGREHPKALLSVVFLTLLPIVQGSNT